MIQKWSQHAPKKVTKKNTIFDRETVFILLLINANYFLVINANIYPEIYTM